LETKTLLDLDYADDSRILREKVSLMNGILEVLRFQNIKKIGMMGK